MIQQGIELIGIGKSIQSTLLSGTKTQLLLQKGIINIGPTHLISILEQQNNLSLVAMQQSQSKGHRIKKHHFVGSLSAKIITQSFLIHKCYHRNNILILETIYAPQPNSCTLKTQCCHFYKRPFIEVAQRHARKGRGSGGKEEVATANIRVDAIKVFIQLFPSCQRPTLGVENQHIFV